MINYPVMFKGSFKTRSTKISAVLNGSYRTSEPPRERRIERHEAPPAAVLLEANVGYTALISYLTALQ